jgi:hypothetical protein
MPTGHAETLRGGERRAEAARTHGSMELADRRAPTVVRGCRGGRRVHVRPDLTPPAV